MTRDKTVKLPATKLCFTATGNPESKQFAEVICVTDSSVATAPERNGGGTTSTPSSRSSSCWRPDLQFLRQRGFPAGRNNLHLVEDAPNGDAYACLADGPDEDLMSDGCIRWLSVKDSSAEPSGILFNSGGRKAYLTISHSDDSDPPRSRPSTTSAPTTSSRYQRLPLILGRSKTGRRLGRHGPDAALSFPEAEAGDVRVEPGRIPAGCGFDEPVPPWAGERRSSRLARLRHNRWRRGARARSSPRWPPRPSARRVKSARGRVHEIRWPPPRAASPPSQRPCDRSWAPRRCRSPPRAAGSTPHGRPRSATVR